MRITTGGSTPSRDTLASVCLAAGATASKNGQPVYFEGSGNGGGLFRALQVREGCAAFAVDKQLTRIK